jgi:hypothetical protein
MVHCLGALFGRNRSSFYRFRRVIQRQLADAASGGMNAQKHVFERQIPIHRNYDLAVARAFVRNEYGEASVRPQSASFTNSGVFTTHSKPEQKKETRRYPYHGERDAMERTEPWQFVSLYVKSGAAQHDTR